ncbi:zf-HC2 domain-containing protein [Streptomyces sp. YIM S03343]
MTTTPWHVSEALAARYADGSLPEPDAWSLEQHLEQCGTCASRVSHAVRAGTAGAVLGEVRAAVLREVRDSEGHVAAPRGVLPAAQHPVPVLTRVLWAVGPAVRGAWSLAVLLVAAGALALAYGAGVTGARPLLLAVAPVVPVLGVALSYGPYADPLYEITASTPSGGLRLLLTRTAAVLAVSLPPLTLAGLLLPCSDGPGAAAWLLPGLALTLVSLALAGYVGCRTGTAVAGGGWLCAVLLPGPDPSPDLSGAAPLTQLAERLSALLGGPLAQGAWAAAVVLCAVALAARRSAYDRLPQR